MGLSAPAAGLADGAGSGVRITDRTALPATGEANGTGLSATAETAASEARSEAFQLYMVYESLARMTPQAAAEAFPDGGHAEAVTKAAHAYAAAVGRYELAQGLAAED